MLLQRGVKRMRVKIVSDLSKSVIHLTRHTRAFLFLSFITAVSWKVVKREAVLRCGAVARKLISVRHLDSETKRTTSWRSSSSLV
ncbi:hypothetical protein GQ43DRAFT_186529 [Delitschia confertaspora ATCC 74209]|uniref:Uncharacterized protein n=1 Tax=Delitschia confertaspora ATCC 74209 TaxID=1513339 RepID=A0A9P4JJV9_9PLEO|nr:hypothetical protein GQ43DRAFT_186529 [Delitschia confertaspora ATCC 74209]